MPLATLTIFAGLSSAAGGGPVPTTAQPAPAEAPPGSDVIASHTPSSGTIYEPGLLPANRAGYFRVTAGDGKSLPAYWMPAGTLDDAPSEIRTTLAYRAILDDPARGQFDSLIYARGVVQSRPTATKALRKRAASQCWDGWSCLFGQVEWGGIIMRFTDENYWQNLAPYNFNNQASSLYNNKDNKSTVYAYDPNGGGSSWICMWANTATASLSAFWNDNITSIYIRNINYC